MVMPGFVAQMPKGDSSRESSVVAGMHEQTCTPTYKTGNWPAYDEALERRASLTIWFDPEMSWEAVPSGKRGRQQTYSGEGDQKTVRGTVSPTNAIWTRLTMTGEGRPGNMPVACFSPERAEPRASSVWPFGRRPASSRASCA